MIPTYPVTRRFGLNTHVNGRDFVCGDVHGRFHLLNKAMRRVRFNGAIDRLFCVGDLIDRGPESHLLSRLVIHPWFHPVRGNHEALLLAYASGCEKPTTHIAAHANGLLDWWNALDWVSQDVITHGVAAMPIAIEVETAMGLVGIVHGAVPVSLDWAGFIQALTAGDVDVADAALYGRPIHSGAGARYVQGVARVYAGHSPIRGAVSIAGNVCALDSGAAHAFGDADENGHFTLTELTVSEDELTAHARAPGRIRTLERRTNGAAALASRLRERAEESAYGALAA
jgi:serine/threonine protein phosphatase 1